MNFQPQVWADGRALAFFDFPEIIAQCIPGQSVLIRLVRIEALVDEINHAGRLLPDIGKTMSDAARNVQRLGATGAKDETHCLVVSGRIFASIEQSDQNAVCGNDEPDVFLVVMQVERFDGSRQHLRKGALFDLEIGQNLQIAAVVKANNLSQ